MSEPPWPCGLGLKVISGRVWLLGAEFCWLGGGLQGWRGALWWNCWLLAGPCILCCRGLWDWTVRTGWGVCQERTKTLTYMTEDTSNRHDVCLRVSPAPVSCAHGCAMPAWTLMMKQGCHGDSHRKSCDPGNRYLEKGSQALNKLCLTNIIYHTTFPQLIEDYIRHVYCFDHMKIHVTRFVSAKTHSDRLLCGS